MKSKRLLILLLLALIAPWAANAQTTVTIGDGISTSNQVPIGTYYNYSITEQLYTATEIGMAGTISSISFYYMGIAARDLPITVYMANVAAENLSTGISLAEADEVFSGTLSVTTTAGWVTIDLDTPFAYDGTSSLLIGCIKGYLYYFNGQSWQGTTVSNMARYTQSDSAGPYTTSTVPGNTATVRPNVQLVITAGGGTVCEKPESIEASNVTANSATLTWTGGSGTYNVEYQGGSVTEWTTYLANTTATSANLTGLTPGTTYQYRVQSVCSDGVSGWKSVSFMTQFGIPLVEEFGTAIPTGWGMYTGKMDTIVTGGTLAPATYGWTFGTGNGVFDNHARVNIYGTSCMKWLVMPTVTMENNVQLSFDMALTKYSGTLAPITDTLGADDKFVVLINAGRGWSVLRQWDNAGSEYVYNNIACSAVGENVTIDLSSYAGQQIAIAFYGESTVNETNSDNNLHIDNVSIDYIPACAKPTSFAVSNVTAHGATFTWTSDASAWQIQLGEETPIAVSEPTYTFTSLAPETTYSAKVRANCSGTYSEWTASVSFTTLVACTAPTGLATSNITGHGATITWTAVEGALFQYQVKKTSEYDPENITWSESFEGNTLTWNDLDPETGYTFALRKDCGSDDGYSTVVTRTFTTAVACYVPTGLAATLTPGNGSIATLNWVSEAPGFVVEYGTASDFTGATSVNVSDTVANLTSLTPETTYYARVKAVCGGNDGESQWSSSISFTPTDAYLLTVNNGTNTNGYVPVYGYYVDQFSKSQFIIPAANLANMQWGTINKMTFYASQASVSWGDATFEVYMTEVDTTAFASNTLVDWASMDKVMNAGSLAISGNQMEVTLDAPYQYMGGNLMIGILQTVKGSYSTSTWYGVTQEGNTALGGYETSRAIGFQNFLPKTTFNYEPGEAPACVKPTQLAVNYIGGTTATVTWAGEATYYNIDVNGTVTNNVTSPYELPNLTLATNYEVMVQADCGSNGTSEWAGPVSFTTDACMPEDMIVVNYELTDSWGDGWNGNYILVVDENCEVVEQLTIESGASATGTVKVCGTVAQFMWYKGSYPGETSWVFTDANGNVLFEGEGNTEMATYDVLYTIDLNPYTMPADIEVVEVGPYTAKIGWTETGTATAWQIMLDGDETNIINANTNPFTLTGLTAETAYTVNVRAVGANGTSAWPCLGTSFTTLVGCGAPATLEITPYPFTADVNWSAFEEGYDIAWAADTYTPSANALWLQYDNDTVQTNVGNSTVYTWTWGVMYPDSLLNNNTYLNKVAFYETDYYLADAPITIDIYSGGDTIPETLLYTQSATCLGVVGVHEIMLANPVAIDPSQNLWIVLTTTTIDRPMAMCAVDAANGRWVLNGGEWFDIGTALASVATYSFMIRGFIDNIAPVYNWTTEANILPPYTIEGLEPETDYVVRVKASCGNDWHTEAFTTPSACDAPVDLTAEDITYNSATLGWTGYQDSYNVRYREAMHLAPDFLNTFSQVGANYTAADTLVTYTIDLSTYSGQGSIAIRHYNVSDEFRLNVDDITLTNAGGAEVFSENFESGAIPSTWVNYDADGDGFVWDIWAITQQDNNGNDVGNGNYCVTSASYNNTGALFPDNWLIIPNVELGGTLTFVARGQDPSYAAEVFGVFVTTDDIIIPAGEWVESVVTEPTWAISGLTHDTEYEWQVQGVNTSCEGGLTDWSEIATFTTASLPTQTITLSQGVNWFSTNLEITLADLKTALTTALPEATSFNIKAKDGKFTRYNGTSWLGGLRALDVAQMYKVTVPADCEITLQGEPINPANHPITFNSKGAYWIGFPLSESMTPTEAFTGFAVSGDIVKAKNGTYARKGGGTSWMGGLRSLEPGQGYIYNSNSTTTRVLTYPAPTAKQSAPSAKQSAPKKAVGLPACSKKSLNTKEFDLVPSPRKASTLEMEAYPIR